MRHRHLEDAPDLPVAEYGLAALDDLLERGTLRDWAELRDAIRADPDDELAEKVLHLCAHHEMYGTSQLWPRWIASVRGRTVGAPAGRGDTTARPHGA